MLYIIPEHVECKLMSFPSQLGRVHVEEEVTKEILQTLIAHSVQQVTVQLLLPFHHPLLLLRLPLLLRATLRGNQQQLHGNVGDHLLQVQADKEEEGEGAEVCLAVLLPVVRSLPGNRQQLGDALDQPCDVIVLHVGHA